MKDYRFGNFLSELRARSGLSQYQLGSLVGVSNKAVSKWENGLARPNSKVLPKLSSVLGVTIDELLACKYNTSAEREEKLAMKNSLWKKTFESMKDLYGEKLPIQVLNRYESEKAELEKTDLIIYFSILSGIVSQQEISVEAEKVLTMLGIPEWYLAVLEKIPYLFPKAHGISYVQLALTLMWYKVNYPELYTELASL